MWCSSGDASVYADAEVLAMVVDSLKTAGLKEFQISVGHARFFRGLLEAAGLDEEEEEVLRDFISNKNFFGLEEFIETLEISDELKELFGLLGNFDLKDDELVVAKEKATKYPSIISAIEELEELKNTYVCIKLILIFHLNLNY